MSKSKTVATSTSAQTVTLAKAAQDSAMKYAVVVNLSGTTAEYVNFTVAVNGVAPTTAVVDADDVLVCPPGDRIPVAVGSTDEIRVSVIAASGTPKVVVLGL